MPVIELQLLEDMKEIRATIYRFYEILNEKIK